MRNIVTIFKKEWDRVIKDKRLVITVMLLPGLMIFIIYSIMGGVLDDLQNPAVNNIGIVNPTATFQAVYHDSEFDSESETIRNIITVSSADIETYQTKIDQGEWDLLIIFPDTIDTYDGLGEAPVVDVYYNQNDMQSSAVYSRFAMYLLLYQEVRSIVIFGDTTAFSTAVDSVPLDTAKITGLMMSSLLPMLVIMFLFAGAMSIGPESIAGEKERGTIATLLITPVGRHELAIGKILSLGVLSLISALSSFAGIALSLPKLMQVDSIGADIYAVSDYLGILVLLFSTVFVIVGIISCLSAIAKNMKEATSLIMPVYIITIVVGMTSMFSEGAAQSWYLYLIPIYSTVQSMTAILMLDPRAWLYIAITVIANLFYVAIFVYLLNKMFNNEKIMFAK